MRYFIMAIIICLLIVILVGGFLIYLAQKIIRGKSEFNDKATFFISMIFMLICLSTLIRYYMDIPSALNGGEIIYTNELPVQICLSHSLNTASDNPDLENLKCFINLNKYDRYGNYRIRYTKLNRLVLEIEKLD